MTTRHKISVIRLGSVITLADGSKARHFCCSSLPAAENLERRFLNDKSFASSCLLAHQLSPLMTGV